MSGRGSVMPKPVVKRGFFDQFQQKFKKAIAFLCQYENHDVI